MRNHIRICLSLLLTVLLIACVLAVPVLATEQGGSEALCSVRYYADGSRDETEIILLPSAKVLHTVTAQKSTSHYTSSNELVWKVTLTGSFSYNGSSSSCTAASTTTNFYQSGWFVYSENTTHSGNTASTVVILKKTVLGVPITFSNVTLNLSCDKNGNLS